MAPSQPSYIQNTPDTNTTSILNAATKWYSYDNYKLKKIWASTHVSN